MKKKIIAADETVKLTTNGELERWAVYKYTLDDLGPFVHEIAVKDDTAEKLREVMLAKEKLLAEGVK